MADVWNELGKAVGRALKPLAEIPAAIWKSLGDAAGDMMEGFIKSVKGISDVVEPIMTPLLTGAIDEATDALMPGSPKKEVKKAAENLTKALMEALAREVPEEGESPPSLEILLAAVAGIITTNVGLYVGTCGVTMGLDAPVLTKELGFRQSAMDLISSFQLPAMIGPTLQAPVWSGVIAPLRMRMNQKFPYLIPETRDLSSMRAKDIITNEGYEENMSFHAIDKTWAAAMLESTARYPSFSELRTMIHRGIITWEDAKSALAKSLIHVDHLAAYEGMVPSIPGFGDLRRYAIREAFPDATTFEEHFERMKFWMMKQGYSDYFATADWNAHWIIPSIGQADEMLHRGMITVEQHRSLYILNDIRPEDIDDLRALTWKLPGRIESRWMFRWGEVDVTDLRDALVMDGLDPAYADKVAIAVAKNQFLSDINRQVANIKGDYARGYSVETSLRSDLSALGLRSEMVEYHVVDALSDRVRSIHDEELRTLRAQYARGAITMADVVEASTKIIVDKVARDAWLAALPTAKQVIIMEETFGTEINRLVTNAKYDYVRGYTTKPNMVSRLQLLDLPVEVIEFHVMDADEDRARGHKDKSLAIIEEGYIDDVISWEDVESMARPILVDEEAYNIWLDGVWLNKHKAVRVFASE